jgi:hypothetical protein
MVVKVTMDPGFTLVTEDFENRLVTLHSALIEAHEEEDISPRSVIYRPVGSTRQLVTKLIPPQVFAVLQGHRYLEPQILDVQNVFVSGVNILSPSPLTPLTVYRTVPKVPPPLYSGYVVITQMHIK